MNKKKIFIAVDTNKISKAKKIIKDTQTNKIKVGYKFGLEFFYSKDGRKFISSLKNQTIFLDLKLNDIPNTVSISYKIIKKFKDLLFDCSYKLRIKCLKSFKKRE